MREVIIAHTDDTLKDYINKSTNKIISSDTVAINDGLSISKVAEAISKVLANTENILVFSLEVPINGSRPNELKAAELIYHLRATHQLSNPIVVVAMQTLSAILRQQSDLTILNAQGVYFADVLSDFSFFTKIKTHYERYVVIDIKKDYLRHFQNKLNAVQVRHEQANIYGLKQLIKIHKAVTGDDIAGIEFPNSEDNLDFLLADFVFGENERKYSKVYNNDKELDKAYLSNLQKIKDKNVFVIDDQSKMWLPFYKAQLEGANVVDFDFDASDFDIHNNIGEDDWIALKEELSEEKDWIILLDLRINPNEDNERPLESISGILLLQLIKEHFPYIPVIITTASNKSKTLAKLASMKVDGYWVKEGIDGGWTAHESIENYFRLPELLAKATSEHFIALKELFKINQFLSEDDNCWFSDGGLWRNGDARKSDKQAARNILDQAFVLYKRHCRDFVMNFNYSLKDELTEQNLSSASLINYLGSAFETITGMDINGGRNAYSDYKKKIPFRIRYSPYNEIKKLRNASSHSISLSTISGKEIIEMLNLICLFIYKKRVNKADVNDSKISYLAKIINIEESLPTFNDFDIEVYIGEENIKGKHQNSKLFGDNYNLNLLKNDDYIPIYKTTEVSVSETTGTTVEKQYFEITPAFLNMLKKNNKYIPLKATDKNGSSSVLLQDISNNYVGQASKKSIIAVNSGFFIDANTRDSDGVRNYKILSEKNNNYSIASNTVFDISYKEDEFLVPNNLRKKKNTNNAISHEDKNTIDVKNPIEFKECSFENKKVQIEVDSDFHIHWYRVKDSVGNYFGAVLKAKINQEEEINELVKGKTKPKGKNPGKSIIKLYNEQYQVLTPQIY